MKNINNNIVVIAVYQADNKLREDNILLINQLIEVYSCFLIYVGSLENTHRLDNRINIIRYGKIGYDLNCYKLGLKMILQEKKHHNCKIVFMNNSIIIYNYRLFFNLLSELFFELKKYNLVSFAENKEINPHYQSFLFALKLNSRTKFDLVLSRLINFNKPLNRESVIQKFELKNLYYLNKYNLKTKTILRFDNYELIRVYLNFIFKFGFLDNIDGLIRPVKINGSTYGKFKTIKKYGFAKIKTSTFLNGLKKKSRKA